MTVLFVVLGILMAIGGFSCMFTPLLTFMEIGYFIVILVTVYGILGIVQTIRYKKFGLNFAFSIISVLFGVCMLFFPELLLFTNGVMLYMTAAWFVMMGIISIITAVTASRVSGSKMWILQLIFGILAVLIGGYSFFHPMLLAVSLGLLIGVFFVETGFTLMFAGFAMKE